MKWLLCLLLSIVCISCCEDTGDVPPIRVKTAEEIRKQKEDDDAFMTLMITQQVMRQILMPQSFGTGW